MERQSDCSLCAKIVWPLVALALSRSALTTAVGDEANEAKAHHGDAADEIR